MWSKALRECSFKSQFYNVWKLLPLYRQLVTWTVVAYNSGLMLKRALSSFWGSSNYINESWALGACTQTASRCGAGGQESLCSLYLICYCHSGKGGCPKCRLVLDSSSRMIADGCIGLNTIETQCLSHTTRCFTRRDHLEGSLVWKEPRVLLLSLPEVTSSLHHSYVLLCFSQSSVERNQQQKLPK